MEAAARLFASHGYAGTSVREIIRAAGVSRPVLYYHFGSKEGLYLAVAQAAVANYEAAFAYAAAGADDVVLRIRRVCRAHAVVGRELARLNAAGVGAPVPRDETSPSGGAGRVLALAVEALCALIAEGVASGELAPCDPSAAALALVGAAEVSVAQQACTPSERPNTDRVDGVVAVILRGLAPREQPKDDGVSGSPVTHRRRRQ